jgi:hypothetical protein
MSTDLRQGTDRDQGQERRAAMERPIGGGLGSGVPRLDHAGPRAGGPFVVANITSSHAIEGKEATDRGECEA